jgi:hypothetical protein
MYTKSQTCPTCGNMHTGNSQVSQEKADKGLQSQINSCRTQAAAAKKKAAVEAVADDEE